MAFVPNIRIDKPANSLDKFQFRPLSVLLRKTKLNLVRASNASHTGILYGAGILVSQVSPI